jgi:hypothetical protein
MIDGNSNQNVLLFLFNIYEHCWVNSLDISAQDNRWYYWQSTMLSCYLCVNYDVKFPTSKRNKITVNHECIHSGLKCCCSIIMLRGVNANSPTEENTPWLSYSALYKVHK